MRTRLPCLPAWCGLQLRLPRGEFYVHIEVFDLLPLANADGQFGWSEIFANLPRMTLALAEMLQIMRVFSEPPWFRPTMVRI